jgi:dTDP-4-amino-4,6-dideoxygalactose transaminase
MRQHSSFSAIIYRQPAVYQEQPLNNPIPFLDLPASHAPLKAEILAAIGKIIDSCQFTLAENVTGFEQEFAAYTHSPYAVAVGSGTDALVLALEALGVCPGDEVIVPTWTFAASAAAVCHVGARPVFVDCAPGSFLLDLERTAALIGPKTKAIMPVHLYGEMVDMEPLMQIAQSRGIKVVEDAAQSDGAFHAGRASGTIGDAGCFSFYPTKSLGSCGEGGMVLMRDKAVHDRVRHLRAQADDSIIGGPSRRHSQVGYNSRLQELQAAILRIKLRYLDTWNTRRRAIATAYAKLLAGCPVKTPNLYPDATHIYGVYSILTAQRAELTAWLKEQGIGSAVYYPIPLHLQPAYAFVGCKEGDMPVAEAHSRQVLALPMFPEMTDEQVERVAAAIQAFYTK